MRLTPTLEENLNNSYKSYNKFFNDLNSLLINDNSNLDDSKFLIESNLNFLIQVFVDIGIKLEKMKDNDLVLQCRFIEFFIFLISHFEPKHNLLFCKKQFILPKNLDLSIDYSTPLIFIITVLKDKCLNLTPVKYHNLCLDLQRFLTKDPKMVNKNSFNGSTPIMIAVVNTSEDNLFVKLLKKNYINSKISPSLNRKAKKISSELYQTNSSVIQNDITPNDLEALYPAPYTHPSSKKNKITNLCNIL